MRASLRPSASTSALAPRSRKSGAVVRDFKKRAFPMAEERWSVAVAGFIQRLFKIVASQKSNGKLSISVNES
jgi:hypothetical protein